MLLQVQLSGGVDDVDPHPHRDNLDDELGAPIGDEADAVDRLMAFLKG